MTNEKTPHLSCQCKWGGSNISPYQTLIGIEEHQRSYLYLLIDQLNKENFTHVGFWKVYQLREMACNSCCKFQKFKFPFHMHPPPHCCIVQCIKLQTSNLCHFDRTSWERKGKSNFGSKIPIWAGFWQRNAKSSIKKSGELIFSCNFGQISPTMLG